MSYDPYDLDAPVPPIPGLQAGTVLDNTDPLGLGRVRVTIPGLMDEGSGWALPLGTVGGGERGRGFFSVPSVGSEVAVLFEKGDPDNPYYLSGHWGAPGGVRDVPQAVREAPTAQAPQIHAFETGAFELTFNDSDQTMGLRHKNSNARVEINDRSHSMPRA